MTVNLIIPLNIVLEVVMMIIQGFSFAYGPLHQNIDLAYLSIVPAFFVFSWGWLVFLQKTSRYVTKKVRVVRALEGIALMVIGVMMMESERRIAPSYLCHIYEDKNNEPCQMSWAKLVAGALAILDGLLYFFRPTQKVLPEYEVLISNPGQKFIPIEEEVPEAVEVPSDYYVPVVLPVVTHPQPMFQHPYPQAPGQNLYQRPYEDPPPYSASMMNGNNPPPPPPTPATPHIGFQQQQQPPFPGYNFPVYPQAVPGVPPNYGTNIPSAAPPGFPTAPPTSNQY